MRFIAKLIRWYCRNHDCFKCRFDDHGKCRIMGCPNKWYFKGEISLDWLDSKSVHGVTKKGGKRNA